MSIINEALKKVEPKQDTEKNISNYKKRKRWTSAFAKVLSPLASADSPPKLEERRRTIFIFLILGLILIIVSFTLSGNLLPEKDKSSLPPPSPLGLSKADAFPSLTLKGVAHFGEENWAIIDDQITRQGQFIKGAKVEEIFSDRVDLTFEGKRFTLKITP